MDGPGIIAIAAVNGTYTACYTVVHNVRPLLTRSQNLVVIQDCVCMRALFVNICNLIERSAQTVERGFNYSSAKTCESIPLDAFMTMGKNYLRKAREHAGTGKLCAWL